MKALLSTRLGLASNADVLWLVPTWGGLHDVTSQRTSAQEARLVSALLVSLQGLLVKYFGRVGNSIAII